MGSAQGWREAGRRVSRMEMQMCIRFRPLKTIFDSRDNTSIAKPDSTIIITGTMIRRLDAISEQIPSA